MKDIKISPTFIPSYLSIFISILVLIYLTTIAVISKFGELPLFGRSINYLDNQTDEILEASGTMMFVDGILSNNILNEAVFFLLWAFIGFMAYMLVTVLIKGFGETAEMLSISSTNKKVTGRYRMEKITNFVFRAMVLILLIIHSILFFEMMMPFAFAGINLFVNDAGLSNAFLLSLSVFTVFISIYIYTLLFRFVTFRARVFG